jgi:ABC-type uncharacterized transport system permease subunit
MAGVHPGEATLIKPLWLQDKGGRMNAKDGKQKQKPRKDWRAVLRSLSVPVLAIITALILGGLVIVFTDQTVYKAFGEGGLGAAVQQAWKVITVAYGAFWVGAFGDPRAIWAALRSGDSEAFLQTLYPFTETAARFHPLYLFRTGSGLGVPLQSGS